MGQTEKQPEINMETAISRGLTGLPRFIFRHVAGDQYPTLVFVAGLHGNEPASVQAMQRVFEKMPETLGGNLYALVGNRLALAGNHRFLEIDLNRAWTAAELSKADDSNPEKRDEWSELADLKQQITDIIARHGHRKLVFFDLHTTSADSCPFLPFNDALMNRDVAEKFPVPLILGIEEHLEGSFMSYINDLDFPALAFEGGSHSDPASVDRHAAFIQLSLHHFEIRHLSARQVDEMNAILRPVAPVSPGFYEILFRYHVPDNSGFTMRPGFRNFQSIQQGDILAKNYGGSISAPESGRIFMPLYQEKGSDGFFIVRRVSVFWLRASALLRRWRVQRLVKFLPGVEKHPSRRRVYVVNPRVTRFLHRQVFHLLGFRVQSVSESKVLLVQRD